MEKRESKNKVCVKCKRKEKDVERVVRRGGGGRGNRARGALETELCVLLNAGHKLPVFCFRETMRELTQGREESDGKTARADSFFLLRLV